MERAINAIWAVITCFCSAVSAVAFVDHGDVVLAFFAVFMAIMAVYYSLCTLREGR